VKTNHKCHTRDYLTLIGVPPVAPSTSAFDPGYDPITLQGHLQQSSHLISILKISMACWLVADEYATRQKIALARAHEVATVTGRWPIRNRRRPGPIGTPIWTFAPTSA